MTGRHWLRPVLERAGLDPAPFPELSPDAALRECWPAVADAYELSNRKLAQLIADHFRLEPADLRYIDPAAIAELPEDLARKHAVLPLTVSERQLVVATSDPTDLDAERALGFKSGRTIVFRIAAPTEIQDAIDQNYSSDDALERILGTIGAEAETAISLVEERGPESISSQDVESAPVIRLASLILKDGIQLGASDIHIEPGRLKGAVRYRVDGVLRTHMELPMTALSRVISRIKILSRLDISVRLRPQDGKARAQVEGRFYDLRVSTIPAGGAEKCVIRILDTHSEATLDDLAMPAAELDRLRQLLNHREGVILMTGPTGSGKTTTLYAAIRGLADGRVNVMTVENPVEYDLPSVTQTQVEPKQGVTFASALRAILRQDPDVILVGEIRDRETAETAAQAALTGHLVLATVHANDAVGAIARLLDLGLQRGTVAAALRGSAAQRLVRKVCRSCAESVEDELTPEEERLKQQFGAEPRVRAVGCADCGFTGYRGRLPVLEVMPVGATIQKAIEMQKGQSALQELAVRNGMRTMRQVAIDWVDRGLTTLIEVERALGQGGDEPEATAPVGPPRILIVDDDPGALEQMSSLLSGAGYEVDRAEDGEEALDRLKSDPTYALVILDLRMPRVDGREVLRWIRGSIETVGLPVIVRTGNEGEESEAELLEAGADDYLIKTVGAHRFLARVRAILRRTSL